MNYNGITSVMIPTYDEKTGDKEYIRIQICGKIARRKLIKGIVQFIRDNLGRTVGKEWIEQNVQIYNVNNEMLRTIGEDQEERQRRLDKEYLDIWNEHNSNESKGCNDNQAPSSGDAALSLSNLPNKPTDDSD